MNQPFNHQQALPRSVGDTWNRFWFEPVDALPLAFLRVLAGTMAIVLWASYALDLEAWFGPQGIVSAELIGQWRSPWGLSLFDAATTRASLWAVYAAGGAVLVLLTLVPELLLLELVLVLLLVPLLVVLLTLVP